METPATVFIIINDEGEVVDSESLTGEYDINFFTMKTEAAALKVAEKIITEEGEETVMVYKLVPAFQIVRAKPTIHKLDED